jgi:predicted nuclease of predicted toxin-antitoxin system
VKVLLDSCVWGGARTVIEAAGHAVDWVGDWPADPGDEDILAQAARLGAVLVTIDKDFGELAVVRGLSPCGDHPDRRLRRPGTRPGLCRRIGAL